MNSLMNPLINPHMNPHTQKPFTIALAGNPNVGKSTIFNALTHLRQHTGNWAGKTVACASGRFVFRDADCDVVDLPGIYSLRTHSEEEEIAREYICSGMADLLLVVCDATCLERGLHLLKQIGDLEDSSLSSAILCVNLCDEAEKKGISLDFALLSERLHIPVIPCMARKKHGLDALKNEIYRIYREDGASEDSGNRQETENKGNGADGAEAPAASPCCYCCKGCPYAAALASDGELSAATNEPDGGGELSADGESDGAGELPADGELSAATISEAPRLRLLPEFSPAELAALAVTYTNPSYRRRQDAIDRLVTGRVSGGLLMIVLLLGVFWLTITGANYPSSFLWDRFYALETWLASALTAAGAPLWFIDASVYGVFRVLAWIISVMLPPMAIFFPLFTLLEDLGYLPRVAFNMDCAFKKCRACGKQCLTMAMGLGCNAAGVVGCRIIDSPRERLIAILTNALVPCNGRFPTLIMLITLFFMGSRGASSSFGASLITAGILTGFILLGVFATLFSSWLLSKTLLRGMPSSFTLELPPYRRPQFGKVIVRSIFDRTLFVLGRAVLVAAPAGLVIWLMANIGVGGQSLLWHLSSFLDPIGRFLGMDGIILVGFILGFPANEIVIPIILMAYLQTGRLVEMSDSTTLMTLFTAQGWTVKTALCMAVFSLFHWPCSTTCLTIKKETGSLRWTAVAFLLPTLIGVLLCSFINLIW